MDFYLFLITIFYLPLIKTTPQPFIDCNGKSFLCENSTHFTICVNVGGGLSMTVGNIVLPCPPSTFCNEMNAFECEYHASTTQNSFLQDIDIQREVTEPPLTTNIYNEFFYSTDSQHTKETIVIPKQGNTKVIFKDEPDYAFLLYDNIDDATLYNTPANETIQKNRNDTKSDPINELKNVNKKFIRRNKDSNQEFEAAHYELSTIIEQATNINDKITTFTELSSDNIITELPTAEFVTANKNFDEKNVEYISHVTNYISNSQNNLNNSIRNNKNVDLRNDLNVNNLVNNTTKGSVQYQPKIIESSTSYALTSNSIHSDVDSNGKIENSLIYTNSETTNSFTTEHLGTLGQNISYQTTLKNHQKGGVEDTIVFHDLLLAATADDIVISDLSTTPVTYIQNDDYSKAIIPSNSSAHQIETIALTANETVWDLSTTSDTSILNHKFSKSIIPSNSTEHLFETIAATVDETVSLYLSTTSEPYTQSDILSKAVIPKDSSDFDISFGDLLKANKDFIELKTPAQVHFTNVDSIILDSTIKSEHRESLKDLKSTTHNNSENYGLPTKSSENVTPFNFDTSYSSRGNTNITSFVNRAITDDNFRRWSENTSITNTSAIISNNNVTLTTVGFNVGEKATNIFFNNEANQDMTTSNEEKIIKNTNVRNKLAPNLISSDGVSDDSMTLITPITGEIMKENSTIFGIELENSTLYTNSKMTSGFTTENLGTLEQNISYQTISKNNQLGDTEDTIVFDDLLFDATTDATVIPDLSTTTETNIQNDKFSKAINLSKSSGHLIETFATTATEIVSWDSSTTPKTYINSDVLSKAVIPTDTSDSDISFGDLLKVNKDFIELETSTQVHFTFDNSTVLDSIIKSENEESLKDLGSSSPNSLLNDGFRTKSSENETVTSDLSRKQETYVQNDKFQKAIIPSYAHLNQVIAATVDETVTSNLNKTPESYIKNDILSKTVIPTDTSNFDISFNDLLKVNKNLIELKTPTQIHFNVSDDSTILDSTIEPENKESVKDLRPTSISIPFSYGLHTKVSENLTSYNFDRYKSTEGNTPGTPLSNRTITGANFVNNETIIVVNKTLNKGFILEDGSITANSNFFFQNPNIGLKTAIIPKKITAKIQDEGETTNPRYNLAKNVLNISTVAISEEGYTKPIETNTTPNVNEQKIVGKVPISLHTLKNLHDKNIEDVEIIQIATASTDETQGSNKIIKRTNSELLKDTFNLLEHSTQPASEVSDFDFRNIDDATVNYIKNENTTINLIDGNKLFFWKSETQEDNVITTLKPYNNREIMNDNSTVAIVENLTEFVLNISNITDYITNKEIVTSDVDKYQEKQITISDKNTVGKTTEFDILVLHNQITVEASTNTTNGYSEVPTNGSAEVITNGYTEGINTESIINETFFDLINNVTLTVAPITNSINHKVQDTKFTDYAAFSEDITEVPIEKYSIIDKTPEKQLEQNRKENLNGSRALNNIENLTERTLDTQIPVDTFDDLIKDVQTAATISSSGNNIRQTVNFTLASTVLVDNAEVPVVSTSLIIEDTKEKHLLVKENINQLVLKNTDNFTQNSFDNPISIDDVNDSNFVIGKVTNNGDIFYNVQHNTQDNFTTLNKPHANITTENTYLTTNYLKSEITSNMSSTDKKNLDQKVIETLNKISEKTISTVGNHAKTLNDTLVNLLNKGVQASTISSSINDNNQETYLWFNLFKSTNSIFNLFNETNNLTTKATIEINKDSVLLNDSAVHRFLQVNESVGTNTTDNITIDKFANENYNSKVDSNLSYDKPMIRIGLHSQFNLHDITTKSIDTIVKVNERINVDNITELSQHNSKSTPTLSKENVPLIQNCSNGSSCLSQVERPMSIELHDKTIKSLSLKENIDSTPEEKKLDNNRTKLNANVSDVLFKTELGADHKIVMKTERYINDATTPSIPIYLHSKIVEIKDIDNTDVVNHTKDGPQLQASELGQSDVSDNVNSSTNLLKRVPVIYNLTNKNYERDNSHIKINSRHINVTIPPLIVVEYNKSMENKNKKNDEMPTKKIQNPNLQSRRTTPKTNILKTPNSAFTFDCSNHSRGRYADKGNCRKFYICIGYVTPIVGRCPVNTVFSEFRKQCTNNLSHCIRNNQFKCMKEGRFIDVWQENVYYLCVNDSDNRFTRFKFQCKNGYVLDKVNITCKLTTNILKLSLSSSSNSSPSSSSSSSSSLSSSDKKKGNNNSKKSNKKLSIHTRFKCNKEGKFVDPNNCRKYYACTKTSKSGLRRKKKKCDSDEVFDDDKKKCVNEDSYECK